MHDNVAGILPVDNLSPALPVCLPSPTTTGEDGGHAEMGVRALFEAASKGAHNVTRECVHSVLSRDPETLFSAEDEYGPFSIYAHTSKVSRLQYEGGVVFTGLVHNVTHLPHGYGTKWSTSGHALSSPLWVNGKANGFCLAVHPRSSSLAYLGQFKDGVRSGPGFMWRPTKTQYLVYSSGRVTVSETVAPARGDVCPPPPPLPLPLPLPRPLPSPPQETPAVAQDEGADAQDEEADEQNRSHPHLHPHPHASGTSSLAVAHNKSHWPPPRPPPQSTKRQVHLSFEDFKHQEAQREAAARKASFTRKAAVAAITATAASTLAPAHATAAASSATSARPEWNADTGVPEAPRSRRVKLPHMAPLRPDARRSSVVAPSQTRRFHLPPL